VPENFQIHYFAFRALWPNQLIQDGLRMYYVVTAAWCRAT